MLANSLKIEVIPKNRIVSLDPVIDAFKNFDIGLLRKENPFKIDEKQLQRNHNTNDFIIDFDFVCYRDAFEASTEKYLLSGITQQKYVDIWPQELEDIFADIDNWRIRRFCPYIDLFEFMNEDGSSSLAIEPMLLKDVGLSPLGSSNSIYGIPDIVAVHSNRLTIAHVSSKMGAFLAKMTNKTMFPCYIHATALNKEVSPWIFQGYRMLTKFDDPHNSISLKTRDKTE